MVFLPGYIIGNADFSNVGLLLFSFSETNGKEEWFFSAEDCGFVSPCSFLIMLHMLQHKMAMVHPMGKVFNRWSILASRNANTHSFPV
jgi:hypothetical protein